MRYENNLKKLKRQEQATTPVYNWPLIGALGLVGVGLLINGLAWLVEVWATRSVWSFEDSLMAVAVAMCFLCLLALRAK